MKVKVYSQTGRPVNPENAEKYAEDFKKGYDQYWQNYQNKKSTIEEMKQKVDQLDRELSQKYPMYETVNLPTSGKQWSQLISSFECPVILAIAEQDKKLTIFLMDSGY